MVRFMVDTVSASLTIYNPEETTYCLHEPESTDVQIFRDYLTIGMESRYYGHVEDSGYNIRLRKPVPEYVSLPGNK